MKQIVFTVTTEFKDLLMEKTRETGLSMAQFIRQAIQEHIDRISTLEIALLNEQATKPVYARRGDSGMDIASSVSLVIDPGEYALVPTGLALNLAPGTEAQIRPRSGLAARHGVTVLNSPGTVDSGYKGEIKVILVNFGKNPFQVSPGMRIAQMVITPVIIPNDTLHLTLEERGDNGFGSTGL